MTYKKLTQDLVQYMEAGFPIIYLNTFEEAAADGLLRSVSQGKRIIEWNSSLGYSEYSPHDGKFLVSHTKMTLDAVMEQKIDSNEEFERSLFVIKDAHTLLEDPTIVAYLKELAIRISTDLECTVFLVSSVLKIPSELENFITILELDYLTQEDIRLVITLSGGIRIVVPG